MNIVDRIAIGLSYLFIGCGVGGALFVSYLHHMGVLQW